MAKKFTLDAFKVTGLHGQRTINIPIKNNRLILVGENGSGKTTLITLLYLVLSRQWSRLFRYSFESLELVLNKKTHIISRHQLEKTMSRYRARARSERRRLSPAATEKIDTFIKTQQALVQECFDTGSFRVLRDRISHDIHVHPIYLEEYLSEYFERQQFLSEDKGLKDLEAELDSNWSGQFLYLPTYRRIEQDLQSIFPDVEVEKFFDRRITHPSTDQTYTELVEFGMRDVEEQIKKKMKDLQDNITTNLKSLTGSYLSDIIAEKYKNVQFKELSNLTTTEIDSILSRIEESVLSSEDKNRIQNKVAGISPGAKLSDDQRIIVHFLFKLRDLYSTQQEKEKDTRQLIDLCNKYLVGKQLEFNSNTYNVSVEQISKQRGQSSQIALKQLSSGEKQIVSLFCHMFLSGVESFFLLIDEPELSLSVPWQKSFLVDILTTKRCAGLIAVTHSPFIFENELDTSAHAIDEFWT